MKRSRMILLLSLAFVGGGLAADEAKKETVSPTKEVVYKTLGEKTLKLHVFNPPGFKETDSRPAIVFFFGGGWNGGTPSQFYPQCEHLASRGMVAISAEYRVKSRDKTTPKECVIDGKSALRWVRKHAKELGVDPEMIAAGGGSAGGHVAAAMVNSKGFEEGENLEVSSRPAALVLFNPVFDNGPKGYGHDRVKDYWKEISPMHNISKESPPTVVFLGTKDDLIPVATAEDYKKKMEAAGGRCDLHLYEGQKHGFFNSKGGKKTEGYAETLKEMDAFLVSLGFLEEE